MRSLYPEYFYRGILAGDDEELENAGRLLGRFYVVLLVTPGSNGCLRRIVPNKPIPLVRNRKVQRTRSGRRLKDSCSEHSTV